jgi:hypothetical protein
MNPFLIFNFQVTIYCVVVALAAAWFVMPRLRRMEQHDALTVPLLISSLRVTGMLFLVPNLNVGMPPEFSQAAAYGDSAVALLALVGALANRARSPLGTPLAWAYAILGGLDLGYGFFQGFRYGIFDHLGGNWFPVCAAASLVVVSLGTLFVLLLRPNPVGVARMQPADLGPLASRG